MRHRFLRFVCLLWFGFLASAHGLMQTGTPGFSFCISSPINVIVPCDPSVTSINYGPATVGLGALAELKFSNPGAAPLVINYSFSSPDFVFDLVPTLPPNPFTVQPGAAMSTIVSFVPQTAGPITAQFVSNDNAAGAPHVIPLSGTGVVVSLNDFALMLDPVGPSSIALKAGTTTNFPVYLLEGGGLDPTAVGAIQCSGGPPGSTCRLDIPNFPALVPQVKVIVSVVVPAKTGALPRAPFLWEGLTAISAIVLLRRRRRRSGWAPILAILLACFVTSCGGSSSSSSAPVPPITVTAGVNGLSHNLTVPVTVQ